MRRAGMVAMVLGLLTLSMGCASNKGETAKLQEENALLRQRLGEYQSALAGSANPNQVTALQSEIAQREARIRELEAQIKKPDATGPTTPGIEGVTTSYDRRKGELTVSLPADILFASGNAQLKDSSLATLEKVIGALRKEYAGKKIRVEGHTDNDPIVHSKDQWIDNLDLSLNRAASVSRYLISKGVDRKNIATVGWGDAAPRATKAASRRVEIIVVVG